MSSQISTNISQINDDMNSVYQKIQ